jgi:hypothetical protein
MIAINVRHWEHGNHGFARWRPVAPQPFAKPSVGGVATFGEAVMISVPIDLIHIYIQYMILYIIIYIIQCVYIYITVQ